MASAVPTATARPHYTPLLAFIAGVAITLTTVFIVDGISDAPMSNSTRAGPEPRRGAQQARRGGPATPADNSKALHQLRSHLHNKEASRVAAHNKDKSKSWKEAVNGTRYPAAATHGLHSHLRVLRPLRVYGSPLLICDGSLALCERVADCLSWAVRLPLRVDFSALTDAEKTATLGHSLGAAPKGAVGRAPLGTFRAPLGRAALAQLSKP
jgi:hypothetical protein